MLPLIAAGTAGLGSLLGGRSRNKAAKKSRSNTDKMAVWTIEQAKRDAAKALELARGDEERLKAASGYDLVKLRADAEKGGFNPLTLLQATGGAGYDGRGAVVMSPFMPIAGFYGDRANLYSGNSGAVVNTAGYVGDAISSAGSAFVDQANQDRANSLDAARVSLLRDELAMAARPFGGGGGFTQTTGSPNTQAVSSPFFPGSISKLGQIAEDWWNVVPEVAPDVSGIWKKFSRFGTSTVYPEGPDGSGVFSGLALEAMAKAKLRSYLPKDVERGWMDSATDFGATMWGGLYQGGRLVQALGGWPRW